MASTSPKDPNSPTNASSLEGSDKMGIKQELDKESKKTPTQEAYRITKDKKPQAKRKFHTKSRNGCTTCKRRRVKCDETKPICNRCGHIGFPCSYVTVDNDSNNASSKKVGSPSSDGGNSNNNNNSNLATANGAAAKATSTNATNAALQLLLANTSSSLDNGILSNAGVSAADLLLFQQQQQQQMQQALLLNLITNNGLGNTVGSNLGSNLGNILGGNLGGSLGGSLGAANPSAAASATSTDPLNVLLGLFQGGVNTSVASLLSLANSNELYPGLTTLASQASQKNSRDDSTNSDDRSESSYSASSLPNDSTTAPTSATSSPKNDPNSLELPSTLNVTDLKLMYNYTNAVWPTITAAGISEEKLWSEYIPKLSFEHPFLMHSVLAFSATHLSRTEDGLDECVTYHRGESLRLLRDAVLEISLENTDALVASAIILIMDALANASLPSSPSKKSLPASAWIYHVKGAATILTAVWPLNKQSKFHKFISVDLSDLGDIINNPDQLANTNTTYSSLQCFDESISDLYPVEYTSPYLITLAYLDKLYHERYKSDFILRIFAFPALLDKTFLALLMTGDVSAMRIMRCYYSMLRDFTNEMRDKVWFLEGVCNVLPADVDDYSGGGGMHMMLDFLGGGLPSLTTVNLGGECNMDPGFMKFEDA